MRNINYAYSESQKCDNVLQGLQMGGIISFGGSYK